STLDYLRAVAIRVVEETGLLPHLNPGVMTWEDMARLKHVSASMGLMLETSSERLSRRVGPHLGSPDKEPARPLPTIDGAGRLARRLAAHARPREPGEAVAPDRAPGARDRRAGPPPPRATDRLPGVRAAARPLDRGEDAAPGGRAGCGRRPGPRGPSAGADRM